MKRLYSTLLAALVSLAVMATAIAPLGAPADRGIKVIPAKTLPEGIVLKKSAGTERKAARKSAAKASLAKPKFRPEAAMGKPTVNIAGKQGSLKHKKDYKASAKAAEEADYSFEVLGNLCVENGVWDKLAFCTGDDIAYVSFMLFSSYYEDSDFNAEGLDYIAQNGSLIGTDYFWRYLTLTLNNYPEGVYTMASVAMDAAGTPQALYCKRFFVTNHNPEEWQSLGMGEYTELFASAAYPDALPEQTYKVEVLENIATPGIYRILDPCANHSGVGDMLVQHTHPHYITINATDPDYVYVDFAPYGINCGYGEAVAASLVSYYQTYDIEFDEIKGAGIAAGKLVDGEITFPSETLLYAENEYRNLLFSDAGSGALLKLPGNADSDPTPDPDPEPTFDYSLEFSNNICLVDDKLPFSNRVGQDVAKLYLYTYEGTLMLGDLDDDALAAIVADEQTLDITPTINSDEYHLVTYRTSGKYTNIAIATDADGRVVNAVTYPFFVEKNSDLWGTVGTATFTDLFSTVVFPNDEPCTYEVTLQENINTPGYYRLVNPYRNHPTLSEQAITDHDHYIYLHTEDGMAWIEEWPSGIDYGYGEAIMISDFGYYKEYFGDTIDDLINKYDMTDGQINGNEITFPPYSLSITAHDFGFSYKQTKVEPEQVLITLNKTGEIILPWEQLGKGVYFEGLFECLYPDAAGKSWKVNIEAGNNTPGVYRLSPYSTDNPVFEPWGGTANRMIIHAEDPEKVWIEPFYLTPGDPTNPTYKIAQFVNKTNTWTADNCSDDNYGRLADGAFTFPAASFGLIAGQSGYYTNETGKFRILLPGTPDYSIRLENELCTDDGRVEFTISTGDQVAETKYAIIKGRRTDEELPRLFGLDNGTDISTEITEVTTQCTLSDEGIYMLVVAAYDAEDNLQTIENSLIYHTENADEQWRDYAVGEYTDLYLSDFFAGAPAVYDVTVQINDTHPGLYRIEDPYRNHPMAYERPEIFVSHNSHKHYIYIHAEDPDLVWVEARPVGLDFGYGEVILSSRVADCLNLGWSLDLIKESGKVFGIKAGRIVNDNEFYFETYALTWTETKYRNAPFFSVFGEGCLLKLKEVVGAQDLDLKTQDTDATYYNLQGIRIDKPQAGRLYIRCQGNKASKAIAK